MSRFFLCLKKFDSRCEWRASRVELFYLRRSEILRLCVACDANFISSNIHAVSSRTLPRQLPVASRQSSATLVAALKTTACRVSCAHSSAILFERKTYRQTLHTRGFARVKVSVGTFQSLAYRADDWNACRKKRAATANAQSSTDLRQQSHAMHAEAKARLAAAAAGKQRPRVYPKRSCQLALRVADAHKRLAHSTAS